MISSFAPQLQNRAASVTSITISVVAMNATSPESSPKPLSIYCEKIARKRSTTPVPPMSVLPSRFAGRGFRKRPIADPGISLGVIDAEEAAALLGPGGAAIG